MEKLFTSLLMFVFALSFSQNWGTDSLLNPSFANDNRFNQTLDLSGTGNTTPILPDWTQELILYQLRENCQQLIRHEKNYGY